MAEIPTPHIEATSKDQIAKVVLLPGDPLRAKWIAETFLGEVTLFNQVRGMLGYTGTYQGQRVSVMGSGMGFGSIGIYSYELYKFYDVNTIMRVGSCGGIKEGLKLMDIILVDGAFSIETFARQAHGFEEQMMYGSQRIYDLVQKVAAEKQIALRVGNIMSDNVFYSTVAGQEEELGKEHDILAVEMESFALFANARALNKEAACLLTVSDIVANREQNLTPEERQKAFNDMMVLALETAVASQQ